MLQSPEISERMSAPRPVDMRCSPAHVLRMDLALAVCSGPSSWTHWWMSGLSSAQTTYR
jgi:hypothetical protein